MKQPYNRSKMYRRYSSLKLIFLLPAITYAAECQEGWIAYKDELCIKMFNSYSTYDEAKSICSAQGDDASLVIVKNEDTQELLANYTRDTFDYLWLGGKYDKEATDFKWEDGETVTYTNWQKGYPRGSTEYDSCIELRPVNAKASTKSQGKWADVNCQKRNMVMCQMPPLWSLEDAIGELIRIRKKLEDELQRINVELTESTNERNELKKELASVSSKVVPVGSINIEYYNQPSPRTLWPNLTWQDISSFFAGLFFRVTGGGAASWGSTQAACAPRITQFDDTSSRTPYPKPMNIPASGWSEYGPYGGYGSIGFDAFEGLRFHTRDCEVRPNNKAIRVWKRTA